MKYKYICTTTIESDTGITLKISLKRKYPSKIRYKETKEDNEK